MYTLSLIKEKGRGTSQSTFGANFKMAAISQGVNLGGGGEIGIGMFLFSNLQNLRLNDGKI